MQRSAYLYVVGLALLAFAALPLAATAEECLQVGWKNRSGDMLYYPAHIVFEKGQQVHMNYEYHHGQVELKVSDKEKGDGQDVIVMRGKWFEGDDAQRSGKIRVEMKRGTHHATGWYTNGDNENGPRYSFVLRDCPVKR